MKIHVPVFVVALFLVPIAALTADPPATSTAATPATALPATALPATALPAATPTTATPAATAPAATAPAAATSDPSISKVAHSLGYKTRQHDGKTVYCKSETKVGASFPSTTCLTEGQVMAAMRRSEGNRDSVEALQRAFRAGAPPAEPQMGMRGQ